MNQQLQYLAAALLNRWTTSLPGVAIACMLAWYLGPLVPGLSSTLSRALLMVGFVLIWAVVNFVIGRVRRRRDRALTEGIADGAGDIADDKTRSAEEVARLRTRLRESLGRLRKARGKRRGALYEQPWFVLIGPPGSGKTTALANAGLEFPLPADHDGDGSVRGVGGTRLCDWWFADEAVLIDTAGRYTTQDSDEAVDRAGWLGFLDLLRRTRPRQPLNGIIMVMSLVDIAAAPAAERAAHARAVRRRIKEITERLRLRLPVYAVFSKTDCVAGFTEYFDDLDGPGRTQVWGSTFPLSKGVETFVSEFRLLLDRLAARLFERMQAERGAERRALIAGFPLQLASLQEPLSEFLAQAFGGSRLDPAPFLRGVYLTSATQQGTPIDRITGMLARSFGVDQQRTPSLRPVAGRSYFLSRLLRDVILNEALLASSDPKRARRRALLRGAAFGLIGVATIAAGLLLWQTDREQAAEIARSAAAVDAYRDQLATLTLDPVDDDDLRKAAPVLDAARNLQNAASARASGLFGLSQASKLAAGDQLAYQHALDRIMLPRLLLRLERQMGAALGRPDFLYEATRVYLMLGSEGPLDAGLVRAWLSLDWQQRYGGALDRGLRDGLAAHLDAMLSRPLPQVTLDGALVATARATFSRVPLAKRVYGRLPLYGASSAVPPWVPSAVLGPDGVKLFTRASGKPLTEGIPGLYTANGFHQLMAHLADASREVAGESWVLGRTEQIDPASPAMKDLERDVITLYVADDERLWQAMLDDLALVPFRTRDQAIQVLYVLGSPQSPMRDLLASIGRELTLAPPPEPAKPDAQDAQLRSAYGAAQGGAAAAPPAPGTEVDAHFAALRGFTAGNGDAAPIAGVLRLLNALQQELVRLGPNATDVATAVQGSGDPVRLLLAEASRQPQPVARWLRQLAVSGSTLVEGGTQAAAAAAFSGSDGPGPLCRQLVTEHYPFDAQSSQDASIDDFTHLFAPAGLLDAYFKSQLKPFVSTDGAAWRAQPLAGVAAPVSPASLAQFQNAAGIRDMFFPAGGTTIQVRFDVTPAVEDVGTKATLTLGRTTVADAASGGTQTSLTWPGDDGLRDARLSFDAPAGVAPVEAHGPWALFRLLDQATVSPADAPGTLLVRFRSGGHEASFLLHPQSAKNPFGSNAMRSFRCPAF